MTYNDDNTQASATSPVGGVTEYAYWPNGARKSLQAPTTTGQAKALPSGSTTPTTDRRASCTR